MNETVECYSGIEYPERPTAFLWQAERRTVSRIAAEARTTEGKRFEVVDERGERFTLSYDTGSGRWLVTPRGRPTGEDESKKP